MNFKPEYGAYTAEEWATYEKRIKNLMDSFEDYKRKNSDKNGYAGFNINLDIADKIIVKYLNQLKYFKIFHDANKGTDHYKRAAYISILIAVEKPIYFEQGVGEITDVNADFALFVLCNYLNITNIEEIMKNDKRAIKIFKNLRLLFLKSNLHKETLNLLCIALEAAFVQD